MFHCMNFDSLYFDHYNGENLVLDFLRYFNYVPYALRKLPCFLCIDLYSVFFFNQDLCSVFNLYLIKSRVHFIVKIRTFLFQKHDCKGQVDRKLFYLQPMLDVPIYGRIATLELFRPHVSIILWHIESLLSSIIIMLFMLILLLAVLDSNRAKHKIFYSSQLKDTSFVFFNGMQRILRLLQGLSMKQKQHLLYCSFHLWCSVC